MLCRASGVLVREPNNEDRMSRKRASLLILQLKSNEIRDGVGRKLKKNGRPLI